MCDQHSSCPESSVHEHFQEQPSGAWRHNPATHFRRDVRLVIGSELTMRRQGFISVRLQHTRMQHWVDVHGTYASPSLGRIRQGCTPASLAEREVNVCASIKVSKLSSSAFPFQWMPFTAPSIMQVETNSLWSAVLKGSWKWNVFAFSSFTLLEQFFQKIIAKYLWNWLLIDITRRLWNMLVFRHTSSNRAIPLVVSTTSSDMPRAFKKWMHFEIIIVFGPAGKYFLRNLYLPRQSR